MKNRSTFSWKKLGLAICAGMLIHAGVQGQCVNNLGTRSYDTLLTGPGYGTYTINFPQWNPDSGLLVSVTVNARVSVQYGFTMKNADAAPSIYTLVVGRQDYYSSAALPAVYDHITEQTIGVYPLNPNVAVIRSPFPFLDNYNNVDSITGAVVPFMGHGQVSFVYAPITYTTLHTNNNSSYNYSASAADQTHFSITYLYCKSGGALASGLRFFTARAEDQGSVRLDWGILNESRETIYEVERSRDGQTFVKVGAVRGEDGTGAGGDRSSGGGGSSEEDGTGQNEGTRSVGSGGNGAGQNGGAGAVGNGIYNFVDRLSGEAGGKYFYRLRVKGSGSDFYSEVREVDLAGGTGRSRSLWVYPNPAKDRIHIDLPEGTSPGGDEKDWLVEVFGADGVRVYHRNYYRAIHRIEVSFGQYLSAGVYFVHTSDLQGQHSYFSSFVAGVK